MKLLRRERHGVHSALPACRLSPPSLAQRFRDMTKFSRCQTCFARLAMVLIPCPIQAVTGKHGVQHGHRQAALQRPTSACACRYNDTAEDLIPTTEGKWAKEKGWTHAHLVSEGARWAGAAGGIVASSELAYRAGVAVGGSQARQPPAAGQPIAAVTHCDCASHRGSVLLGLAAERRNGC